MSSVYNDLGEGVEREGGKLRNCLRGIICLYAGWDPRKKVLSGVAGVFPECSLFVHCLFLPAILFPVCSCPLAGLFCFCSVRSNFKLTLAPLNLPC